MPRQTAASRVAGRDAQRDGAAYVINVLLRGRVRLTDCEHHALSLVRRAYRHHVYSMKAW